jgi:hypothetical protein
VESEISTALADQVNTPSWNINDPATSFFTSQREQCRNDPTESTNLTSNCTFSGGTPFVYMGDADVTLKVDGKDEICPQVPFAVVPLYEKAPRSSYLVAEKGAVWALFNNFKNNPQQYANGNILAMATNTTYYATWICYYLPDLPTQSNPQYVTVRGDSDLSASNGVALSNTVYNEFTIAPGQNGNF